MARNINELLKIEDFSEMDNDEIALVMAYRAEMAAKNAEIATRANVLQEMQSSMINRYVAAQSEANKAFNNAISTAAQFKAV